MLVVACHTGSPGAAPPEKVLNFPAAVATSTQSCATGPCFLILANSNFDLRYNAGTLQSWDLESLSKTFQDCGANEKACDIESPAPYILSEVKIGSYTTAMGVSKNHSRVYVAVKGDRTVSAVDVGDDGKLECGSGGFGFCNNAYRYRDTQFADAKNEPWGTNPSSIYVGSLQDELRVNGDARDFLLVPDEGGGLALLIDDNTAAQQRGSDLMLPAVVSFRRGMPQGLTSITWDKTSSAAYIANGLGETVVRAQVAVDQLAPRYENTFAYPSQVESISGTGSFLNTRDVWVDARVNKNQAYFLMRVPSALMFATVEPDSAGFRRYFRARDIIRISDGASRITAATLTGSDKLWLFASTFDAREVFIFDADDQRVVSVIRGFSGPFELTVDTARRHLIVTDFRASVVRWIDLSPLLTGEAAKLLATVGVPKPVEY